MNQWMRLVDKLEDLRRWETRKRRERLLLEALVYGSLAALLCVPIQGWLPAFLMPVWLAPLFFLLIAAVFLVSRRFRLGEMPRILNRLDRELGLAERSLTAWEILGRPRERLSERVVLEEAGNALERVSFRSLFKREFGWQAYAAPVVLLVLLLTPWLPAVSPPETPSASTLAHEVKQLASRTAEQARREDLTEANRIARDLAEVAEKKLRGDSNRRELGHALGAVIDSIEDVFQSLPLGKDLHWPGIGGDQLSDVRKRLQELEEQQALPDSLKRGRQGLLDELGLSNMTQAPGSSQAMSENEVREFLEKLTREAKAEQERRLLDRTREALSQLLLGDPRGSGLEEFAGRGPSDKSGEPGPEQGASGSLPGNAPASPGVAPAYDPEFRARVRSHLEGLLGEGPSRGFGFRGRGQAGESTVSEEEVVVHYERQIEEQMASEEIPADFKDTIKKYFLSLGVTQGTQ